MTVDPAERDRMTMAIMAGMHCDLAFARECERLGLDPAEARKVSPLLALARQRARFMQEGRA